MMGKRAFQRKALRRPHPTHPTLPTLCLSKGRHRITKRETLPCKNTYMRSPEGNQAIWTPSPIKGLTGDPGIPGWGVMVQQAWHKPAQRGHFKILRRCLVSPSLLLYKCLPERGCAPLHMRRPHWSELSPPEGTARLGTGIPRRCHPLSSGPTSAWRQPSLSADLRNSQRAAQSFWRSICGPHICATLLQDKATPRLDPPPRGQCLQVHLLIMERHGGNLAHISRPGSQDNMRVGRPKHKTLFPHQKC